MLKLRDMNTVELTQETEKWCEACKELDVLWGKIDDALLVHSQSDADENMEKNFLPHLMQLSNNIKEWLADCILDNLAKDKEIVRI